MKAYVAELVVCCGSEQIARHRRSYEREELTLDQAAPLEGGSCPKNSCATTARSATGQAGKREYVQVLRLLEDFLLSDVAWAARQAFELGTISFDAVKHLLLCRIEQRPPRLDLTRYPHLPAAEVEQTATADYLSLLARGAI